MIAFQKYYRTMWSTTVFTYLLFWFYLRLTQSFSNRTVFFSFLVPNWPIDSDQCVWNTIMFLLSKRRRRHIIFITHLEVSSSCLYFNNSRDVGHTLGLRWFLRIFQWTVSTARLSDQDMLSVYSLHSYRVQHIYYYYYYYKLNMQYK